MFSAGKANVSGGAKKWKEERQEATSHKTSGLEKTNLNLNTLDKQCISTVQNRSLDLTLITH